MSSTDQREHLVRLVEQLTAAVVTIAQQVTIIAEVLQEDQLNIWSPDDEEP